jgi:hypothetical protein
MYAPKMEWSTMAGRQGVSFDFVNGKSLPELVKSGSITLEQQTSLLNHLADLYKPKFASFRKKNPNMEHLPKLDRNPDNFIIPKEMLSQVEQIIKSGDFSKLPKGSVAAVDILESTSKNFGHDPIH